MTNHPPQEIEAPVKRCAYCGNDLAPGQFHSESETVSSLRAQLEQAQSELGQARTERDAARSDAELQQKNITFKAKQLVELRAERDTYKTMYEFALQQHDKQEAQLTAAPAQGWRLLSEGEVMAKDDEWWDDRDYTWNPLIDVAGEKLKHGLVVRRRVVLAAPASDVAPDALVEAARPTVVCLCGSTRFKDEFVNANLRETLAGKIVLSIGCDMRTDVEIFGHMTPDELDKTKTALDVLHKRKIDLADEVLILNVGGYIGNSTRSELEYAIKHNKVVRWLEPVSAYAAAQKDDEK